MAAVGLANRMVKIYKLDHQPEEVKTIESQLKFQVSIFSFLNTQDDAKICSPSAAQTKTKNLVEQLKWIEIKNSKVEFIWDF